MDVSYHSRRNKDHLTFDQWAKEVRDGIPKEEADWITDNQLQKFYDQGMIVFIAWWDVQELYEQKDQK